MSKPPKPNYPAMRSFFSYIARYKLRFAIVICSFIVSSSLLAIIPIFIGKLIGSLAATPVHSHQAIVWVSVLIACSTLHDGSWHLSELLYLKLIVPLGYLYENIVFQKIVQKPYPYFVDKFTGKMSSYVGTIGQELRTFFENICFNYTSQFVNLLAITTILSIINWQTGLVFLICLVSMFFVGRVTIRNSAKYEKLSADAQSTKNGKIVDAIANFVNIKSFRKEQVENSAIAHEQNQAIKAAHKSFFWGVIFWGSMSFFIRSAIWPVTIGLNVYLFLHHQLSLTQLATLLSALLIFSTNIWEVIWYASQFNLKLARIEEAHNYLFGDINIVQEYYTDKLETKAKRQFVHVLELRNLTFAYPDKKEVGVLDNIRLELKKGEKIGVVGRSGSGKTTLTKLLLGYYPIDDGQVYLDGTTIESSDLARLVSYVPQDTSLFHRTIAENIAYATNEAVSRDDVVRAAKQAHADEFIAKINDGYDALVGERGVKLSAGQRQRIAIARAFLDDKPILILDEATSALDSESEVLVQEALEALWEHKTVIAIAHRLSTLRHMDKIIVLDKGQIVEQGSHQQLLEANGSYASLWNHQSGGFLEE